MSPPLTAPPDRSPHGAHRIGRTGRRRGREEMRSDAATTKKRRGRHATLLNRGCCPAKRGYCLAEVVLRRAATLPLHQAFQRGDRP